MEWVERTAKTLDAAKELALESLGIGPDDAEFEILEEPRPGLFGRLRGEARVRARVRPAVLRPKQDRRPRRKNERRDRPDSSPAGASASTPVSSVDDDTDELTADGATDADIPTSPSPRRRKRKPAGERPASTPSSPEDSNVMTDFPANEFDSATDGHSAAPAVDVQNVRVAAEEFTVGLLAAFGVTGTANSTVEGNEIDVRVDGEGDGVGLLIGPSGRTLLAVQDLARVAAQRRLGDHETRLRIDIAGYREKRRAALERFAQHVADLVTESGIARSLDPMPSADRKIIHDTLSKLDGVSTRSEGEDPFRRIIVSPA